MVAVGLVLSGCATDGEQHQTTTTSAAAQGPTNPWDLPLEQRPPLFDPCEEIPVEALDSVKEVLGGEMTPVEGIENEVVDQVYSCGWSNREVTFGILATWQSKQEFVDDPGYANRNPQFTFNDRQSFRANFRGDEMSGTCHHVFFTSRGSLLMTLLTNTGLGEFQGEMFTEACRILDQAMDPIFPHFPGGDF